MRKIIIVSDKLIKEACALYESKKKDLVLFKENYFGFVWKVSMGFDKDQNLFLNLLTSSNECVINDTLISKVKYNDIMNDKDYIISNKYEFNYLTSSFNFLCNALYRNIPNPIVRIEFDASINDKVINIDKSFINEVAILKVEPNCEMNVLIKNIGDDKQLVFRKEMNEQFPYYSIILGYAYPKNKEVKKCETLLFAKGPDDGDVYEFLKRAYNENVEAGIYRNEYTLLFK